MTVAQVSHISGGFILGCAGPLGAVGLRLVLTREQYQETETYLDEKRDKKQKTNVAWSDLQEWATGYLPGLAVHVGFVATMVVRAIG